MTDPTNTAAGTGAEMRDAAGELNLPGLAQLAGTILEDTTTRYVTGKSAADLLAAAASGTIGLAAVVEQIARRSAEIARLTEELGKLDEAYTDAKVAELAERVARLEQSGGSPGSSSRLTDQRGGDR